MQYVGTDGNSDEGNRMDANGSSTEIDINSTLQAVIDRLEEKCSVIDAAEASWQSERLSGTARLRILVDIRRTLIDSAIELESIIR